MAFYERRPPHVRETNRAVFLTWRLKDSLPSQRVFPREALNSGKAFAAMDRLLDSARFGAFYLRDPAIADMIVDAIHYNAEILRHYLLRGRTRTPRRAAGGPPHPNSAAL
jgi:hypothetical protein